mmetsp:Transcript_82149/g.266223  ORF Transcript_82149/g.266223 Transcript_82149/m.266223 type:complete len:366 (+) Transcript_82149:932-2029(+)
MSSASTYNVTAAQGISTRTWARGCAPGTDAAKARWPATACSSRTPLSSVRPTPAPSSCTGTPGSPAPQQRVATETRTLARSSTCKAWPWSSATGAASSKGTPAEARRMLASSRPKLFATWERRLSTEANSLSDTRRTLPSGSSTLHVQGCRVPICTGQCWRRRYSQPPISAMRSARGVGSRACQAWSPSSSAAKRSVAKRQRVLKEPASWLGNLIASMRSSARGRDTSVSSEQRACKVPLKAAASSGMCNGSPAIQTWCTAEGAPFSSSVAHLYTYRQGLTGTHCTQRANGSTATAWARRSMRAYCAWTSCCPAGTRMSAWPSPAVKADLSSRSRRTPGTPSPQQSVYADTCTVPRSTAVSASCP